MLRAALRYAEEYHLAVFPCFEVVGGDCVCPRERRHGGMCGSPGKHPRTGRGFQDATTEVGAIRRWWGKWPGAHIGIATGERSGIVVVDVDPRNGGDESLHELEAAHGALPETPRVLTGGGGVHVWFARPQAAHVTGRPLAQGVDIKADGGYVIAAPSGHLSGRRYGWELTAKIGELPFAVLPDWIADKLARPKQQWEVVDTEVTAGFMGAAFEAAGWLIRKVGPGRYAAVCPWERAHTSGCRGDSSTVVFAPQVGSAKGWFHCSHEHCRGRSQGEVVAEIPAGMRGKALERLGLPREYDVVAEVVRPVVEGGWQSELVFSRAGQVSRTPGNAALLLTNLPEWQGALEYDEFLDQIRWVKPCPPIASMPAPRVGALLEAAHVTYVQQWFTRHKNVDFGSEALWDAIGVSARAASVHPVRRYLDERCWDGVGRLGTWLSRYCGAPDHDLVHRIGVRWMVSAVARVKQPGCQADHLLVLEGPQGVGKSQAVRALAGPWYLGNLPAVHSKDAMQVLPGHWIVEIAELEALRGVSLTRVKDWITQPADTFRPSYGRVSVRRPRQCVFIATTNEETYLHDASGNRRFWPVPVTRIDLAALQHDRDQLWAEARVAYEDGVQWWPTDDETEELKALQASRVETDVWDMPVLSYLDGRDEVTLLQVFKDVFNLEPTSCGKREQMRLANVLKRHGWMRARGASRRWRRDAEQGGLW